MNNKSRRPVVNTIASLLMLILIATAYAVSPFISTARADPADLVGLWIGNGTYDAGANANTQPFGIVLSISSTGKDTFSGVLTEPAYQTKVHLSNITFDGTTVTFTDTSYVSGNEIQLNCTYT